MLFGVVHHPNICPAGKTTRDLMLIRQTSYHCAKPAINYSKILTGLFILVVLVVMPVERMVVVEFRRFSGRGR